MMLTADSELRAQWLLRGGDTGTWASVEQSGAHGLQSVSASRHEHSPVLPPRPSRNQDPASRSLKSPHFD